MNDILRLLPGLTVAVALGMLPARAGESLNPGPPDSPASAADSSPGIVLLGGQNALALRASPSRQMTRIERYALGPVEVPSGPTLTTLSDDFATDSPPQPEPMPTATLNDSGTNFLEGDFSPPVFRHDPALDEQPPEDSELDMSTEIALTWTVLAVVALLYGMRRRAFDLLNRAIFLAVARVRRCGADVVSRPRRHRRRRHARRQRGADVRWYFQMVRDGRGSRRRWRSGSRQREFVVADVVVDRGAAGYSPTVSGRYLLSCNDN